MGISPDLIVVQYRVGQKRGRERESTVEDIATLEKSEFSSR